MTEIPTIRSPLKVYEGALNVGRFVPDEDLVPGQVYELFMRNYGAGSSEAYLAEALIEDVGFLYTGVHSLRAVIIGHDNRNYAVDSTIGEGIWRPDRPIHANDRSSQVIIPEGILLPPGVNVDVDREFNKRSLKFTDPDELHSRT